VVLHIAALCHRGGRTGIGARAGVARRGPHGYIGPAAPAPPTTIARRRAAMSTTFDDREKAFENKFKRDQELQFKVNNRRNKLLGLWAAAELGKTGDAAEAYAKEVVMADFDRPGDEDVLNKVVKDLEAGGKPTAAADVRKQMTRLLDEAKHQVMTEVK
jgi:hypothetical protein